MEKQRKTMKDMTHHCFVYTNPCFWNRGKSAGHPYNITVASIFSHWVACSHTEIAPHACVFTRYELPLHLQVTLVGVEISWITCSDDAV